MPDRIVAGDSTDLDCVFGQCPVVRLRWSSIRRKLRSDFFLRLRKPRPSPCAAIPDSILTQPFDSGRGSTRMQFLAQFRDGLLSIFKDAIVTLAIGEIRIILQPLELRGEPASRTIWDFTRLGRGGVKSNYLDHTTRK